MEINFKVTKVFDDIWNAIQENKYKLIVEEGSSRSSKTWSNFQVLFLLCTTIPRTSCVVLRETAVDCKDIVEKDFMDWLADPNARGFELKNNLITIEQYDEFIKKESLLRYLKRNATKSRWTFSNGSTITFNGLDKISKAMGMTQSIVWLNEPYKFSEKVYRQLAQRTSMFIIADWNPMQNHWLDNEKVKQSACLLKSTFLDNPFVPEKAKNQLLSYQMVKYSEVVVNGLINESSALNYDFEANELNFNNKQLEELKRTIFNQSESKNIEDDDWHWLVFGLGLQAERPQRIFKWSAIDYTEFLNLKVDYAGSMPLHWYGVDWGVNDPFAIVEAKYSKGVLYVNELNYLSENKLNEKFSEADKLEMTKYGGLIPYMFKRLGVIKNAPIICDSNYKEKVEALQAYGYINARKIEKPPGSIFDGVTLLQKIKVVYTSHSKNLEREQNLYSWSSDRMGVIVDKPIDEENHLIDTIRYIALKMRDEGILKIV